MPFETDADVGTGRAALVRALRHWQQLDTDWKSVLWALFVAGLIVGLDVPVPA